MTWSKCWKGVARRKEVAAELEGYTEWCHAPGRRMMEQPAIALLSCGTTRGTQDQTPGCRDKLQESDIPSSHTFVVLPAVPRSSSSFSVPAPAVIRDETKPGTVLVPGAGCHQPLTQLLPSPRVLLPHHDHPLEMSAWALCTLLVFRDVAADASQGIALFWELRFRENPRVAHLQ